MLVAHHKKGSVIWSGTPWKVIRLDSILQSRCEEAALATKLPKGSQIQRVVVVVDGADSGCCCCCPSTASSSSASAVASNCCCCCPSWNCQNNNHILQSILRKLSSSSSSLATTTAVASQWCQYVTWMAIHIVVNDDDDAVAARSSPLPAAADAAAGGGGDDDDEILGRNEIDNNNNKTSKRNKKDSRSDDKEDYSMEISWDETDQEWILQVWTILHQELSLVMVSSSSSLQDEEEGLANVSSSHRPLLLQPVDWITWCNMIAWIDQNLCLITKPHPLVQYSQQVLSTLNNEEYKTALEVLHPLFPTTIPAYVTTLRRLPHILKVQQDIQDLYGDHQPMVFGILLDKPPFIMVKKHDNSSSSCSCCNTGQNNSSVITTTPPTITTTHTTTSSPTLIKTCNNNNNILSYSSTRMVHWTRSCLPTAAWDLITTARHEQQPSESSSETSNSSQIHQVALIALYDLFGQEDDPVLINCGPGSSVTSNNNKTSKLNCHCCLCQYEKDHNIFDQLSLVQQKRLGDYYMQQGQTRQAQRLYRKILDHTNRNFNEHKVMLSNKEKQQQQLLQMILPEVHHAMGATYLQQGHFIKAQQYWHDGCVKEYPSWMLSHDGIALQMEKIRAYGYLVQQPNDTFSTIQQQHQDVAEYQVIIPSLCFVTPSLVDAATCRQIIDWANHTHDETKSSSPWTSQRHYAVPTTDVAVHTVPSLCRWFVDWLKQTVQPLLAHQFQTNKDDQRFYCHDAFCVKYEAGAPNSHLPIHCDESTHSFVLSLNDDFEGGGTYFVDHDMTIVAPMGSLVSFRGDSLRHGGNVVHKGVRYILAVFLYLDDDCRVVRNATNSTNKRPLSHRGNEHDDLLRGRTTTKRENFSFGFDF